MPVVLTSTTVVGLLIALVGTWLLSGDARVNTIGIGAALAYLAGGVPAGRRALKALWNEHILDIDLLMIVAAIAAAVVGAVVEGAVLLTLFSLSTTMEERAMGRARRAIEALMELRPETAFRKSVEGAVEEVLAAQLDVGDIVVLRPGARVPADGTVLRGRGALDESTITGESMPVGKEPGGKVFEATVNLDGVLEVQITKSLEQSTVARMIALVTEAQAAKAPSERFSAWFGQRYTIAVLVGSVVALGAFYGLGRDWETALYRAATLLVAASPCAIVISVPAAILSALSAAARGGVLFKGGAALETLAAVDIFAFDKTGTLTTGRAEVTGVVALGNSETAFLSTLASVEAHSEHHIAETLRREAARRGLVLHDVHDVKAIPSAGIIGRNADGPVWAGNRRMADMMGASLDQDALRVFQDGAETVVYLGRETRILGAVSVADKLRDTSAGALAALRASGVKTIAMMTGDRRAVALRIGRALGLKPDEIYAEMLPQDKVRLVGEIAEGRKIAFVGDGVNDAAALARADVGIAMGAAGSEVALQAADVALLSEDMERLAAAHRLSKRTVSIIHQNLILAIGAMLLLVTGAAFLELPLPLAVLGHEGGTVLVVLNGLRLLSDPICNTRRPVTDRESVEQGHDDKAQAGASSQLRNADATTTKTSTIT
ncbi:MAG: cation-translocating P-type ATPase [Rhizobiaceae bacterium]|jgi:Cd2+/Zn2+-exporting ATPase|nr:cation-translocating P-type ATPase [Rhizobiaceae bacterium]MCW5701103.1 cation-translocating P-type ATPase [Bradyrhizobium sp.]MDO8981942.1 cation-translocating P-type ATPase [Afipia sp.]TXH13275.1 MAG: cation-translocating P-type ATPase [Gammaproteobacteria bacterium]